MMKIGAHYQFQESRIDARRFPKKQATITRQMNHQNQRFQSLSELPSKTRAERELSKKKWCGGGDFGPTLLVHITEFMGPEVFT